MATLAESRRDAASPLRTMHDVAATSSSVGQRPRSRSRMPSARAQTATDAHDREILHPPSSSPLSTLLPFQRAIIRSLVPAPDESLDEGDALLIVGRGLGLRSIVASILRIYDGPHNLVLVINATQDEEAGLSEELTTMGVRKPGLRTVSFETSAKARQELYLSGGLLSVTSRILVVDMLTKRIPMQLVTGIVVMHAESITPTSVEAFIARIYRQENKDGFMKAFSDHPEHFAVGMIPLQTVLGQLRIRKVELWPRFHKSVIRDLGQRKADVVELQQPLSPSMRKIQNSIIECLDAVLGELRRGTGQVEVEDCTLENAIFRSFDTIVRRQLDPIWHRLGSKTKQLVGDLRTLCSLLTYLLSYDAVAFHSFLETILVSQSKSGSLAATTRQEQSPWLFMEAANTIFSEARRRVYLGTLGSDVNGSRGSSHQARSDHGVATNGAAADRTDRADFAHWQRRRWWMPEGIEPVLEELPKWNLLREVLEEIEQDIHFTASTDLTGPQNNTILIMTESDRTFSQLRELLSTMQGTRGAFAANDEGIDGPGGRMMERLLKDHFFWKGALGSMGSSLRRDAQLQNDAAHSGPAVATTAAAEVEPTRAGSSHYGPTAAAGGFGTALARKDYDRELSAAKRRRQRGGASASARGVKRAAQDAPESLAQEAGDVANFIRDALKMVHQSEPHDHDPLPAVADEEEQDLAGMPIAESFTQVEFESFFGMLSMEDLVVIRSYQGDDDDKVLHELRPRFVVMYDPDPAFIRRLEVYRSMHPGVAVRVYFLMYAESVEEQRYLSSIRREKESFERLIREKATMALPLDADGKPLEQSQEERLLRTVNSRIAGGQRIASVESPRVIVDMREFRSSLPSMLHAAGVQVIPCTLQVGDYVLTSSMCVERKSLPDLVQSFNSGRLYTQCELMSMHYQHPILLIEFDLDKSFSLQTISETKSNPRAITSRTKPQEVDIQSKLVLLTCAFPRLRIIWSSSPYATSDIFADLKQNYDEPDVSKVAAVGFDDLSASSSSAAVTTVPESSFNLTPQDVLLSLPGINTKNFRYIMNSVRDLAELCDLGLEECQESLGAEAGRRLHKFIHRDIKVDEETSSRPSR